MENAGLTHLSAREVTELKALQVTRDYIRQIADAGFSHLSVREYTQLKALGVTASYIRNLGSHFKGLSVDKIVQLKAEGIDPR